MKRIVMVVLACMLIFTGCNSVDNNTSNNLGDSIRSDQPNDIQKDTNKDNDSKQQNDDNNKENNQNNDILSLLPKKEGFKWIYNGFAEYGQTISIKRIDKTNEQVKYVITGKVDDMSGGESGVEEDHFDLDIKYIIKDGRLIQQKDEKAMMDSKFDSLELIRLPLEKGNKWTQKVVDESGNEVSLETEITDVEEKNNLKTYTVEYNDIDSDYYEIRKIKEGIGVTSFNRLLRIKDHSFEIGYSLYEDMSGYKE